jgi:hypothetical protein
MQSNELRGIIPRCLEYLFAMMAREEKKVCHYDKNLSLFLFLTHFAVVERRMCAVLVSSVGVRNLQ